MTTTPTLTRDSDKIVYGLGNFLLDLVVPVSEEFLSKYDLQPDSTQLAGSGHDAMFDEILNDPLKVKYSPGGCGLNTIRVAQWMLKSRGSTVFVGAVGDDDMSVKLLDSLEKQGISLRHQVIKDKPTGRCAVLVCGDTRTLVTHLGAALHFNHADFMASSGYLGLQFAGAIYISGYFLKISPKTAFEVSKYPTMQGLQCSVVLNINAVWVASLYAKEIEEIFPFVDILIGNESEIIAFHEKVNGSLAEDCSEIAKYLTQLPKVAGERFVVVTRGSKSILIASGNSSEVDEFEVLPVPKSSIVDTNGAGDAFAGGLLAGILQGKGIDVCTKYGLWAASEIIQQKGCNFPPEGSFKESE